MPLPKDADVAMRLVECTCADATCRNLNPERVKRLRKQGIEEAKGGQTWRKQVQHPARESWHPRNAGCAM